MKPTDIALISTKHVELSVGGGRVVDVIRLGGRVFHKPGPCRSDLCQGERAHLSDTHSACGREVEGTLVEVGLASKVLAPCARCWNAD